MSSMSQERILTHKEIIDTLTRELPSWSFQDGYITKAFHTKNWKETILLLNAIAYLSELHNHHPELEVSFRSLKVKIKTHSVDGITLKDINLAQSIEKLTPQRRAS